ncbi:MAG: hypothetical protein BWZ03_00710 [bacterium ADurb.BinA186]|nr:MAG: hypothetical protein BWZ03_00710 [bacterium ADurb.BinA186]
MGLKEIAQKHVEAFAKEAFEVELLPKLKEIVVQSPSKYDDLILGAIEPAFVEAVKKAIDGIYKGE